MKQTAVEFIESKLFGDEIFSLSEVFNQAKEMEKEELNKAWKAAEQNMRSQFSSSVYKNVTFDEYYERR